MDTTYWGRNFGVVVFKDAEDKKILWRKFVRYEAVSDYLEEYRAVVSKAENSGYMSY